MSEFKILLWAVDIISLTLLFGGGVFGGGVSCCEQAVKLTVSVVDINIGSPFQGYLLTGIEGRRLQSSATDCLYGDSCSSLLLASNHGSSGGSDDDSHDESYCIGLCNTTAFIKHVNSENLQLRMQRYSTGKYLKLNATCHNGTQLYVDGWKTSRNYWDNYVYDSQCVRGMCTRHIFMCAVDRAISFSVSKIQTTSNKIIGYINGGNITSSASTCLSSQNCQEEGDNVGLFVNCVPFCTGGTDESQASNCNHNEFQVVVTEGGLTTIYRRDSRGTTLEVQVYCNIYNYDLMVGGEKFLNQTWMRSFEKESGDVQENWNTIFRCVPKKIIDPTFRTTLNGIGTTDIQTTQQLRTMDINTTLAISAVFTNFNADDFVSKGAGAVKVITVVIPIVVTVIVIAAITTVVFLIRAKRLKCGRENQNGNQLTTAVVSPHCSQQDSNVYSHGHHYHIVGEPGESEREYGNPSIHSWDEYSEVEPLVKTTIRAMDKTESEAKLEDLYSKVDKSNKLLLTDHKITDCEIASTEIPGLDLIENELYDSYEQSC